MTAPLLSIAVPVYNAERYIKENLRSIERALTALPHGMRDRVEVVVSNNHSSDDTAGILAAHSSSWRVVQPASHMKNRTDNWNYALKSCSGTWRMMLHADDMLVVNGLLRIMAQLEFGVPESVVLIYGQHQMFEDAADADRPRPLFRRTSLISGPLYRSASLAWNCPFPPFVVFRGDRFNELGGFDAHFELVQDWDLWMRMLRDGDLLYLPVAFGMWRSHGYSPKGAEMFAREQLRWSCDLAPRHDVDGRLPVALAEAIGVVKGSWFLPEGDLAAVAGREVRWQPPSRVSLAGLRLLEFLGILVNHAFRAAGAKRGSELVPRDFDSRS